jgi:D-alanyl-D-alanine carboxypeptidase
MGRSPAECEFLRRWHWLVAVVVVAIALSPASLNVRAAVARYEPPAPPPITADAVYVEDVTSGTELFAQNAETPLPPASLTKIVSALVVLDRVNLDDTIEIVPEDLVASDESQVGLVAGDTLSARDLFRGMLIPSGNDATLALARHVGEAVLGADTPPAKAVAAFVNLMNEKAQALGATSSHFENPTGIDADGHVMSAHDVARLTAVALQNPDFAETVSTTSAVLASRLRADGYPVQTTNELLVEGIANGVKTGTTDNAGGCLATSFLVGPNDIVAVVLGSDLVETSDGIQDGSARYADTRALLDAATADYVWLDPAAPGAIAGLLDELNVWQVALPDSALVPVPAAEAAQIRYRLVLNPPTTPQSSAGEIQFFVGDQMLSERAALQSG